MRLGNLLVLLMLFILLSVPIRAQGTSEGANFTSSTYILVRHAEKAKDDPKDPNLNEAGKSRALRLAALLQATEVAAIYSTPYHRTRNTVKPLAQSKGLKVEEYDPFSEEDFSRIQNVAKGKTVVIVGHSNTIPNMANLLLGKEQFAQMEEHEYNKLILITLIEEKASVTILSY